MKGLEIAEKFYEEYGRPMIAESFKEYEGVIAVGVSGEGSDCFGYDDEISRDHDFDAGFCLWIPDELAEKLEFPLSRAYGRLPETYLGVKREKAALWRQNRRGVIAIGDFYRRFTGRPGAPKTLMEWLGTPEYSLACAVNGKVFCDDRGEFSKIRRTLLEGFPEDVRKKKIAAKAALMAQSGQYNVERCLRHGERGAASLALFEFVQNGLSMIFLLNRRYMPYYKWSFRASKELPILSGAAGELELLLSWEKWAQEDFAVLKKIEEISADVIAELKNQGLSGGSWNYLEPHAYEVMERIQDGNLRNLHVMEG